MSKSPEWSAAEREALLAMLASSLRADRLRGGTLRVVIQPQWTILPFTLIGQSADGPFQVELHGMPPQRQPAGGGYIIPQGVPHRFRPLGSQPRTYHWSHFRLRVLGEVDLFHFIVSPVTVPPPVGKQIARLNRALLRLETMRDTIPLITLIAEQRRLCSQLLSLVVTQSKPRSGAWRTLSLISRLLPVMRFMRRQMARPVLREELTRVAGLSPSRLHALFLAATGIPPQQLLIRMRLSAAQEQLLLTQRAVSEVAESVGFRDAFHFSRMFKRFSGLSPRNYRRHIARATAASV